MGIVQTIESDLYSAVKSKDAFRIKVFRFLKSNLDAAAKSKLAPLTDEEAVKVLQRQVKQSVDAETKFKDGGRDDLAQAERSERDLISGYLPPQLSEKDLAELVDQAVLESGAVSVRDLGKVMKILVGKVAGRADGKSLKQAVEAALNKK